MSHAPYKGETVALFVTCLVDAIRPSVGFAAVRLLEHAGFRVEVPDGQTCCGQPAFNAGDEEDTRSVARRMLEIFAPFDAVVAPSGSCAGMVRRHYPELFAGTPDETRARSLAAKTFELCEFLHMHDASPLLRRWEGGPVAWHDSCSSRRELGIHEAPRALLRRIPGLRLVELSDPEGCCGFGGLFSVKLPEISARMATDKAEDVRNSGAATLVGPDMGCLMNIAGCMSRLGMDIRVLHVAELLAGMTGSGIGEDVA